MTDLYSSWLLERLVLGEVVRLRFGVTSIGRHQSSMIRIIESEFVSRNHSEIEISADDSRITIRDLNSVNGVYVNENIFNGAVAQLQAGDRIGIGVTIENENSLEHAVYMIFAMSQLPPFVLSLDTPTYYGHDLFPNRMYRQLHARHNEPLDMHTLGLIARLGAHGHHLAAKDMSLLLPPFTGKHGFEVNLDVGLFQADELTVKVVGSGDSSAAAATSEQHYVVVEGKHEEREDEHGFVTRHFKRRYELPKGYDPDKVTSTLSSDGVLTVSLPKPPPQDQIERIVQIQSVGPSNLFVKNCSNQVKEQKKNDESEQNEK